MVVEHSSDFASLFWVILDQENSLVWVFSHRFHLDASNRAPLVSISRLRRTFPDEILWSVSKLAQEFCSLLHTFAHSGTTSWQLRSSGNTLSTHRPDSAADSLAGEHGFKSSVLDLHVHECAFFSLTLKAPGSA
jgi:hypothetical protein